MAREWEGDSHAPTLAEETLAWGFEGTPPGTRPLTPETARELFDSVRPSANVPAGERREVLREVLSWWPDLEPQLRELMHSRARTLCDKHRRIRDTLQQQELTIEPNWPPDLLGVVVLLPMPRGLAS